MPSALVCLKASTSAAVWDWMMARSEIWIQDECQVNILLLSATTIIHSRIAVRKGDMKAFSFPSSLFSSVDASHASSRLPSLIFSLLFLPSCPHSIHFHFPPQFPLQLLSFHTNLSIFPNPYSTPFSPSSAAPWQALSHFLHLSVISLPFFQPSVLYFFPCDCSLSRLFPFSLAYIVSLYSLSFCQMLSLPLPRTSILCRALYGPIKFSSLVFFPTLHTQTYWTVQVVQGRMWTHMHPPTHKTSSTVWPWNVLEFQSVFSISKSPSFPVWFTDPPPKKSRIYTHSQARDLIYNKHIWTHHPSSSSSGRFSKNLLAFQFTTNVNKLWMLCISVLCSGTIAKWKGLSWERGPNPAEIVGGGREKKKKKQKRK